MKKQNKLNIQMLETILEDQPEEMQTLLVKTINLYAGFQLSPASELQLKERVRKEIRSAAINGTNAK